MDITKITKAGSLESNDILIILMPNSNPAVEIQLESIVMEQFGEQIKKVIRETAEQLGIENAVIKAQDKGALDYTIVSRLKTAFLRARCDNE